MANGSSTTLPWVLTFISGALGAAAVGFVLGRYSAPEVPAQVPVPQQQATGQDPNALPPGTTAEPMQDWTLVCQGVDTAAKTCLALQQIFNNERQLTLIVEARYANDGQHLFVLRTPLGVALDTGIEFTMPDSKTEAYAYRGCDQATCAAVLGLNDQAFEKLVAAGSTDVVYTTQGGTRVTSTISMKGLTDAFAKIEKPAPAAAAPAESPTTPPAEQPATPENE